MLVISSLLEDEVTHLCGPRHERQPHRTHTRYGHQRGTATLAGQKIPIARPRVRRTDGGGEVPLESYARLQDPEAMAEAVLRRMVRGVSTRDYGDVIDLTRDGFGVQKSSVSRDFVRASAAHARRRQGPARGREAGLGSRAASHEKGGGTPSLHDDWWDRGSSRRWVAESQFFPQRLPLFDPDATGTYHPAPARPAGDLPRPAGSPPRRHRQ